MRQLLRHLFRYTPQGQPLVGVPQVRNHAGGYVFEVDPWTRLTRFLILGSEGATFYVRESELTVESAQVVIECLGVDAERTVRVIADIAKSGRAPSSRPALFALALSFCEPTAVPHARAAFTCVARTGTHLFEFLTAVRAMRGFGRALRGTVADWYLTKSTDQLGYQIVKYRQRSGWTHRDALRLAHPKDESKDSLFAWTVGKEASDLPAIVRGYVLARDAELENLPWIIREYGLTHEMVPSEALKDPVVLAALAERMPLGATVRFLGRFGAAGLLEGGSAVRDEVVRRLGDADQIQKARLHPMKILVALRTYASGAGKRGSLAWPVDGRVVDALSDAFHLAFQSVVPTDKRILLAVDVSGSMSWNHCAGAESLTCAEGAAALALVTAKVEKNVMVKAFSSSLKDLGISPGQRLDDAIGALEGMNFGATDCALPMVWARENHKEVDAFVILTDNETWFGDLHPCVALRDYRRESGIDARLVVVSMTGTGFSIADPQDPGTLDVVGFDAATPRLISDFVAGRV